MTNDISADLTTKKKKKKVLKRIRRKSRSVENCCGQNCPNCKYTLIKESYNLIDSPLIHKK